MGLRLNLGCGPLRIEGEIGIDKYKTAGTDIEADIRSLPYENDTVEFVRLDHVIEHIPYREVVITLLESYRVLQSGGKIKIGVPDFKATCEAYITATKKYKCMLIRNFYGSEAHEGEFHKSGWDKETLKDIMECVGFKEVEVKDDPERTEGICIAGYGTK